MEPVTLIIVLVVLVGLGLFAFSPKFRQLLRIRTNSAIGKGSTPLERQKDKFRELVEDSRKQQANVANVMASFNSAKKALQQKKDAVDTVKRDYEVATRMNASEEVKNDLATKHAAAKAAVTTQENVVLELGKAADEARKALEKTREALQQIEAGIADDEAKSELAAALRTTADTLQQTKDVNSSLSEIGESRKQIDQELERARAGAELAQGSQTEREMEEIRKRAAAEEARKELDAQLGNK